MVPYGKDIAVGWGDSEGPSFSKIDVKAYWGRAPKTYLSQRIVNNCWGTPPPSGSVPLIVIGRAIFFSGVPTCKLSMAL